MRPRHILEGLTMVGGTGIYVTWVTGAIIVSLLLMPILKPPWARITLTGFQDMFRRYWMHGIIVFSIYIVGTGVGKLR